MEPTLRADRFAILTAPAACHACNAPMEMSALLVPAYVQRDADEEEWMAVDDNALLAYVEKATMQRGRPGLPAHRKSCQQRLRLLA